MAEDIKLTILHSNDIHGDFLPERRIGRKEIGGLPLLSGYLKKQREEKENVIYAVAGDMFKGSIIDSEYRGVSTIEMMNYLNPDVVTLGNHEIDYGLAHILFIEKCARFPIVNANMFIKTNHQRLFRPYVEVMAGGLKVLFIGIITDEILAQTKSEGVIGTFVDVRQAAEEVRAIVDTWKTVDTDLTVLLTHIGVEEDKKLAELLDPALGVDLIIGGHSHTLIEKAIVVNGIPIVQAYTGSDQIGRIELTFYPNHKLRHIENFIDPIDSEHCEKDEILEDVIRSYKSKTDMKYNAVLTTFKRELTHPDRYQETELGNLFADLMQDGSSFDLMILGSGSLRLPKLGPVVHLQDLKEFFPYDDSLHMVTVSGAQLKRMIAFVCREEAFTGDHTEFYQYSKQLHFVWSRGQQKFLEFKFNGEDLPDTARIKVAIQDYHYNNFEDFFGVPFVEVAMNRRPRVICTSCATVFEELLSDTHNLDAHVEGRITIVD